MLIVILAGLATVSVTVLIHAAGTTWWIQKLRRHNKGTRHGSPHFSGFSVLLKTALVLIVLHVSEVMVWASSFRIVGVDGLDSFEDAVYFSFTTFTTLGYGDIVIGPPWRLLTGIESLNGVLLLGWSTALSFAVIERVWKALDTDADNLPRG